MKRIIKILILMICTSCDPGVVNKYVVENKTESELKIESKLISGKRKISDKDSIHTVILKPQSKAIIVKYGEIGNANDKGIHFLESIDTIIIKKGHKILNINIFDRSHWTYKVLKKGLFSMDEVEYKIIVTINIFD